MFLLLVSIVESQNVATVFSSCLFPFSVWAIAVLWSPSCCCYFSSLCFIFSYFYIFLHFYTIEFLPFLHIFISIDFFTLFISFSSYLLFPIFFPCSFPLIILNFTSLFHLFLVSLFYFCSNLIPLSSAFLHFFGFILVSVSSSSSSIFLPLSSLPFSHPSTSSN